MDLSSGPEERALNLPEYWGGTPDLALPALDHYNERHSGLHGRLRL